MCTLKKSNICGLYNEVYTKPIINLKTFGEVWVTKKHVQI
jgi:hypothetical protein